MRRSAALTVLLGLLGGNTVMVTSTVYAATHGPGLLGSLGLGGNGEQQGGDQGVSLPQAACQALPVLCQPGVRVVAIPSGVVTLGQPPAAPPPVRHHTRPHVIAPLTGFCVVLCLGSTSTSSSTTSSPTAKPSTTTTTTTTTTTSSGSQSTSSGTAPSASGSAGNCLLGLLCTGSGGPVSGSSTGSPTPTPAPTSGLCLLTCNVVQIGGGCLASLLNTCVGQTSSSPPSAGSGSGSGSGSTGASSGACIANLLCLLGSSCTAQLANTCLLGAILPALPGSSSGSPSGSTGSTGSSGGGTGPGAGGSAPQAGSQPTGTFSPETVGLGLAPVGSAQSSGAAGGEDAPSGGLPPKADQSVGLVSGLSFGHGLILWPLFGLLDLAALAGLVVVVRRRWSATSS